MKKIKVLLVDDIPVIRTGIRSLLESHPYIEVVMEANDGEEALQVLKKEQVDTIIMDLYMPYLTGDEATRIIKSEYPGTKVIVYSAEDNYDKVIDVIKAGADGYLLKSGELGEIQKAIELVSNNENFLTERITKIVIGQLFKNKGTVFPACKNKCDLSVREQEILTMIVAGKSNSKIADHLGLSIRTVETHRFRLMKKIGVNNTAGIFQYAIENKII